MRHFFILVLFFVSTPAFCYPALHDQVTFAGTSSENGQKKYISKTLEIIDHTPGLFKQTTTITENGAVVLSGINWIRESEFSSQTFMQNFIAHCEETAGRTIEKISVTAGDFETCKVLSKNNDFTTSTWYADVPYGIVKSIVKMKNSDSVQEFQLQSYTIGR